MASIPSFPTIDYSGIGTMAQRGLETAIQLQQNRETAQRNRVNEFNTLTQVVRSEEEYRERKANQRFQEQAFISGITVIKNDFDLAESRGDIIGMLTASKSMDVWTGRDVGSATDEKTAQGALLQRQLTQKLGLNAIADDMHEWLTTAPSGYGNLSIQDTLDIADVDEDARAAIVAKSNGSKAQLERLIAMFPGRFYYDGTTLHGRDMAEYVKMSKDSLATLVQKGTLTTPEQIQSAMNSINANVQTMGAAYRAHKDAAAGIGVKLTPLNAVAYGLARESIYQKAGELSGAGLGKDDKAAELTQHANTMIGAYQDVVTSGGVYGIDLGRKISAANPRTAADISAMGAKLTPAFEAFGGAVLDDRYAEISADQWSQLSGITATTEEIKNAEGKKVGTSTRKDPALAADILENLVPGGRYRTLLAKGGGGVEQITALLAEKTISNRMRAELTATSSSYSEDGEPRDFSDYSPAELVVLKQDPELLRLKDPKAAAKARVVYQAQRASGRELVDTFGDRIDAIQPFTRRAVAASYSPKQNERIEVPLQPAGAEPATKTKAELLMGGKDESLGKRVTETFGEASYNLSAASSFMAKDPRIQALANDMYKASGNDPIMYLRKLKGFQGGLLARGYTEDDAAALTAALADAYGNELRATAISAAPMGSVERAIIDTVATGESASLTIDGKQVEIKDGVPSIGGKDVSWTELGVDQKTAAIATQIGKAKPIAEKTGVPETLVTKYMGKYSAWDLNVPPEEFEAFIMSAAKGKNQAGKIKDNLDSRWFYPETAVGVNRETIAFSEGRFADGYSEKTDALLAREAKERLRAIIKQLENGMGSTPEEYNLANATIDPLRKILTAWDAATPTESIGYMYTFADQTSAKFRAYLEAMPEGTAFSASSKDFVSTVRTIQMPREAALRNAIDNAAKILVNGVVNGINTDEAGRRFGIVVDESGTARHVEIPEGYTGRAQHMFWNNAKEQGISPIMTHGYKVRSTADGSGFKLDNPDLWEWASTELPTEQLKKPLATYQYIQGEPKK